LFKHLSPAYIFAVCISIVIWPWKLYDWIKDE
jgi:hypothetical protein